jgi:hypothetical protein
MDQQAGRSERAVSLTLTPLSEDAPWWRIGIAPDAARYVPHGEAFNGGVVSRELV